MGRMLEALKHVPPCRPTEPAVTLRPFPAVAETSDAAENEAIPFIEVGGPRATVSVPASEPSIQGPAVNREEKAAVRAVIFQPLPAPAELPVPARERFAPELVAYHQPRHPISGQYRALMSSLTAQLAATRPQLLLFTAPDPGIGTTTVLLNVAQTAAQQNQLRVAVVDANWKRPAVAERLGLPLMPGLREVLACQVQLVHALKPTGQPNLQALTAGLPGPGVRLVGEPMWALLRQLREHFDLVLMDAPCWDGRPEVVALSSACDAVYLVLNETQAEAAPASDLVQMMPRQGIPLRGCILTQR
jgi:Mrp family chromosome partitioning ATPase